MISAIAHKLLVCGVLLLPMLLLSGLVVRRPILRTGIAILFAGIVAILPFPSDSWGFAALAGALWPLSAGLAVGLGHEFGTIARGRPFVASRDYCLFTWLVILLGAGIYPAALGAHVPDVYALGYQGWTVHVVMAVILAAGVAAGSWLTVAWIAAAAIWTLSGIAPGLNLWDSLVDPVIFIGAIAGQIRGGLRRLNRRS